MTLLVRLRRSPQHGKVNLSNTLVCLFSTKLILFTDNGLRDLNEDRTVVDRCLVRTTLKTGPKSSVYNYRGTATTTFKHCGFPKGRYLKIVKYRRGP